LPADTLPFGKDAKPDYRGVEERRRGGRPASVVIVSGMQFGAWTAVVEANRRSKGHVYWLCRCVCGVERDVMAIHLRGGKTTNCGCLKVEKFRARITKHGEAGSRTHRIWSLMKGRCSNPNLPEYKHYGERGITVCERWQSFENFLADMGEAPPGLSIDRIDNNKGYAPDNCRWATQSEQARNTRRARNLTLNGRTQHMNAWAEELGVSVSRLRWRLDNGWSHERILLTPGKSKLEATVDGVTRTLRQWATHTGLPYSSMISRVERGWSGRDAVYGRRRRG